MIQTMKAYPFAIALLLTPLWFTSTASAANPEHTRQLLTTNQCANCNLVDAGLVYAKLVGADLRGANLVRANLSRADLTGADLSGANLTGASLAGANLTGANLTGAILTGTDLREAYLMGARFERATLTATNLKRSVGLPNGIGNYMDFYRWASEDYQLGNPSLAVDNYNRAIELNPSYAPSYMGRAVSRLKLADSAGAIEDAQRAGTLYKMQGNEVGVKSTEQFVLAVQEADRIAKERNNPGGSNPFVSLFQSVVPLVLQFLPFF